MLDVWLGLRSSSAMFGGLWCWRFGGHCHQTHCCCCLAVIWSWKSRITATVSMTQCSGVLSSTQVDCHIIEECDGASMTESIRIQRSKYSFRIVGRTARATTVTSEAPWASESHRNLYWSRNTVCLVLLMIQIVSRGSALPTTPSHARRAPMRLVGRSARVSPMLRNRYEHACCTSF